MIRGSLLLALIAAVPRFLGPPVKKPDAGSADSGRSPHAPLCPGDVAPPWGLERREGAELVLVAFGPVEPELLQVHRKYAGSGLQVVAIGAGQAPLDIVTDSDGSIERGYRGESADAPRYFLVGRDGIVRFTTSNAGALGREIDGAFRR